MSPKKPSAFLQLFRKLAAAAGQAATGAPAAGRPAEKPDAGEEPRKKGRGAENAEFRAEADKARRPRRGKAPAGEGEVPRAAAAGPAPAPETARRAAVPQAPIPAAVEVRREQRPAPVRVFVVDLRPRAVEAENRSEIHRAAGAPEREGASRSFERALLTRETAPSGPAPASPTSASGSPSSLSGYALRERLLPEIVERAGIVLREGGEGEIRLVLKPEHLGSVRILLRLGESSLEGRIVVDNSNVKELLDANLEGLKSALRQEGYASANIDVTVSGGRDERREMAFGQAPPSEPPAEEFQRAVPAVWDLGFTTVNLFV